MHAHAWTQLLDIRNEINKFQDTTSALKSQLRFYTNSENTKKIYKIKKIPPTRTSKGAHYLEINLIKEVNDLSAENCKTSMKVIKCKNKWKAIPCL